jgi:hypothetical protein
MIVQILVDGRKAGSLVGAKPLDLELAAGTHTVQARMLGNMEGKTIVIELDAESAGATVAVSGTRLGLIQHPLEPLIIVAVFATPSTPVGLFVAKMAVFAAWLGFITYRSLKLRPHLLRLQVSDGITSESRASSRRLSSPR